MATAGLAWAADDKTPWGKATATIGQPYTGCLRTAVVNQTVEERFTAISGPDGHLDQIDVTAPSGSDDKVERVCLIVPLEKPLKLGSKPAMLNIFYHAEGRRGWAQGGIVVEVAGAGRFFDWQGGQTAPAHIRIPIPADVVLMSGGIQATIDLKIRARAAGGERLALDMVSVTDP